MVGLILLQSVPGCFKVQKWRFWIFCWRTTVSLIVRFSTWLFHACKSLGFSSTQLFIPWIFAVHHGTHFLCTHLRLSPIIMIMMIITLWLSFSNVFENLSISFFVTWQVSMYRYYRYIKWFTFHYHHKDFVWYFSVSANPFPFLFSTNATLHFIVLSSWK